MSPYEEEVARLQALVLQALREQAEPEAVGRQLVRSAFPASADEDEELVDADEAAGSAGNGAPSLPTLSAAQQEELTNAVHAAAGQLLGEAAAAGQQAMAFCPPGSTHQQAAVGQLVDAVIWLACQRPAPVDAGLAAQLLEQITEGASNSDCEGIFAYLDSRTPDFKAPPLQAASKLTLLRTCNTLLKRLSKSANAMLCGRVLLFLAKLLPLTERSGVNLNGAFSTDNATPVEEVQEGAVDSEGSPVDAAFYRIFWGLQAFFSNPPAALAVGKWGEVSRDIRRVLDKFRQEKVTVGESAPGLGAGGGSGEDEGAASVKYLSSSRLMALQLRDATFRRHFLLQCLILIQWCEKPRHKTASGLRGKLLEDAQDLRARVYGELEATPDRGPDFTAAIRHLLQWEDSWAAWKQLACPAAPLERPPAQAPAGSDTADLTAPAPKRRKLGSDALFGIRVGTDELDRLWNLTEDNLSALSADDRGGFKTVRQLMEPVIEEMQEAAAGEDDGMLIRASRSKLYSWKALRAVARENLQAFASAVQKGGDLEVAARAMYPSECPPPPAAPQQTAKDAAAGGGGGATAGGGAPSAGGAPADTTAGTAELGGGGEGADGAAAEADDAAGGGEAGEVDAEGQGGAAAAGEGNGAAAEDEEEGELPDDADGGQEEGEAEDEEGGGVPEVNIGEEEEEGEAGGGDTGAEAMAE